MARNNRNDELREERVGMSFINTYGTEFTIIEYIDNQNIVVEFIDGYITSSRWGEVKEGKVKNPYDKSIYGIGFIGEGVYKATVNRKAVLSYKKWHSMMSRCYKNNFNEANPSYTNAKVAEEWHSFQKFAKWHENNYYEVGNETMQLDKDILVKNNKLYSSETCLYVPQRINNLFTDSASKRGRLPIGVAFRKDKKINPYQSYCNNNGKRIHLGYYSTPEDAFSVYKAFKKKLINEVAEEYKDKIPKKLYEAMRDFKISIND